MVHCSGVWGGSYSAIHVHLLTRRDDDDYIKAANSSENIVSVNAECYDFTICFYIYILECNDSVTFYLLVEEFYNFVQ